MNKLYISLIALTFFSCYSTREVKIKKFELNSNVSYYVSKIVETNYIDDVKKNKGKWQAGANNKFILIDFILNNVSTEIELINLENIYLYNHETNMQYKADWSLTSGSLKKMENSIFEIKGVHSIKKTMVFLIPKTDEVIYLKVNNSIQVLE